MDGGTDGVSVGCVTDDGDTSGRQGVAVTQNSFDNPRTDAPAPPPTTTAAATAAAAAAAGAKPARAPACSTHLSLCREKHFIHTEDTCH